MKKRLPSKSKKPVNKNSSNKLNLKVISNEKSLFEFAAKQVSVQLSASVKKKGFATIAFAGGRSAESLCKKLVKQKIDWKNIHIFIIDERLVPLNDSQSNFKLIHDSLITPLMPKILRANVHPFVYDESDEHASTERYADELELVGGNFDVIFVSAGEDGHIAGLYPNHPLLKNTTDYFATFHDSPKPPADRMTALPKNFAKANFSLLLVMGDAKRDALVKIKDKGLSKQWCPAKLVTTSKNHLILTNLKKE